MSPRQPPTATPHLPVRLSRKSDMSVGDQSRSQLAGRDRSFFQLLCSRRQVTPLASPPQLMFPEGLLKWNGRTARAEGPPRACATNTAARVNARATAVRREDMEIGGYRGVATPSSPTMRTTLRASRCGVGLMRSQLPDRPRPARKTGNRAYLARRAVEVLIPVLLPLGDRPIEFLATLRIAEPAQVRLRLAR